MSPEQANQFVSQIQIGTRIAGYGGQVLIVTEIGKKQIKGISEYAKLKYGRDSEISLDYSTLLNPHYSKHLRIL